MKNKRVRGTSKKTGVEKDWRSESHRLEAEEKEVREEISRVNREYKELHRQDSSKSRFTPVLMITWLVIVLMFASMLTTSIGSFILAEHDLQKNIENHVEGIQVEKEDAVEAEDAPIDTRQTAEKQRYYGVTLNRLEPGKREYHPGEDSVIRADIGLNDVEELETTVSYDMYDERGRKVYSYEDEITATQEERVLRKAILLTDNYMTGRYVVDFKARFKVNGKRYTLPGKTSFEIVERPKESYTARLGRVFAGMDALQTTLLVIALLLNLLMLYNAWKLEKHDKGS
ncbi:TPA: hypothetical protein HA265_03125 [Candidatus Woesearchaeota archaeon]|nr:hypothetical protein [Candidatus Woesearchaeota archaeon]